MKIVYCTWSILNLGGLEKVLVMKANYLADVLGHEVVFLATNNGKGTPFYPISPKIKIVDLDVPYEGRNFVEKAVNRIIQRRKLKRKLSETLHELKPDITISTFQNEAPFLPSIDDGSVKVLENHCTRYSNLLASHTFMEKLVARLEIIINTRIVSKYDAVISLTHDDKNDWPSNDNFHVIPNPITVENNKIAHFANKRVIAAGRMVYQKGFDNLLRAWNFVERRHPDWELVIIGSQEDKEYVDSLKEIIGDLGLKRVSLKESTKNIAEEYLQSNIYAMTSNFEGLPLVLIEAMSVGLPLVSFNCKCGPSDIIRDGENGFLVKDKNIEVFADRICQLIEDRDLHARMSAKALEYSKLYELDNIMKRWPELFQHLIEAKKI